MPTYSQRDLRQRDIFLPERLATARASIIGVGAIGRQVALQLAAVGVPELELIDFDLVEPVNLSSQGYLEEDLGQLKVDTTAALMRRINSQIIVHTLAERFHRSQTVHDLVFCCVDSIATRKLIWESVSNAARFFVDARMSAEVIRVLTACDGASRAHYPATLFASEEAFAGSCTAKSTIFAANIAAGLMVSHLSQFLRGIQCAADVTLNLLAGEWTTFGTHLDE
jgi:sulfur carrier protein ThiS adenylyltransferase